MKTLILYTGSPEGCTEAMARRIAARIGGEANPVPLRGKGAPAPAEYDLVVLGAGVRAGAVGRKMSRYLRANLPALLNVPCAIYLCCADACKADTVFAENFPPALLRHALHTVCLGGRLNPAAKGMDGFISRMVIGAMQKEGKPLPQPDEAAADAFADALRAGPREDADKNT